MATMNEPPSTSGFRKLREMLGPPRISDEARQEVVDGILEGAFATRRFYVLLSLSTTIAALGLLSNSTAVIIGAMIVAPLMGPILGLALGMVSANHVFERKSLLAEVTGVILSIAIGYCIGLFPIHPGAGSEMLARTSPTIYDLGIALASGLAGGYASVNKGINSALAGVAVSVALVPPLATCGLFLSMADWKHSLGAFLLFVANFFCIQMAAATVFWIFGLHRQQAIQQSGVWRYRLKFVPSLIAVLAMSWFMTGTLIGLVQGQQFESRFKKRLNEQISQRTGGRLDQVLDRQPLGDGYMVVASALTPKVLDAEQVRQIEDDLKSHLKVNVALTLRSVVSQDMDHSGRVFYNERDRDQATRSREVAAALDKAKQIISSYLHSVPGATLTSLEQSLAEGSVILEAFVDVPSPIVSSQVGEMEDMLSAQLDNPIRLIVRSAATTVTDRTGDLFLPEPERQPRIDPDQAKLEERIATILRSRMTQKPARRVAAVEVLSAENILKIKATVEATQPVRPEEVAKIQTDLRKFVDPRIALSIRTNLGSVADADGWSR